MTQWSWVIEQKTRSGNLFLRAGGLYPTKDSATTYMNEWIKRLLSWGYRHQELSARIYELED